jgi:glyoxylase-like metal-dependent hydrolase (beta-lactamase superfamily II)
MPKPRVTAFFDKATFTVTYVVAEPDGPACAIVDAVLDFDPKSGRTSTASADLVADFVLREGLRLDWILETHAHADHLTAAPHLQERLGGLVAIGEGIVRVQDTFARLFNFEAGFRSDGSQFDRLWRDGERFAIGGLEAQVLATPGHTPDSVSYLVGDAAFVGDTLFMPDYGTARCDFPGGDPRMLYRSIRRILALPPETRLFMCHDYGPNGRPYAWETTVAEERAKNVHVREGMAEEEFVKLRTDRDRTLPTPALLLPAVQVNIRAGRFPPPESNGVSYLKLPLNAF